MFHNYFIKTQNRVKYLQKQLNTGCGPLEILYNMIENNGNSTVRITLKETTGRVSVIPCVPLR